MSLTYSMEAWVISILYWAWLSVQDLLGWSLLCTAVSYAFLASSSCHLVASFLFSTSSQPGLAHGLAVFAFSLAVLGCVLDTVELPFMQGHINRQGCCPGQSRARTLQILYFMDSPLYLAQAGVLCGFLVVQLILAGASIHGVGYNMGPALSALLGARAVMLVDGRIVTRCALAPFTLRVFERVDLDYIASGGFGVAFLCLLVGLDALAVTKPVIISMRVTAFITQLIFGLAVCVVLSNKGVLSPSMLASFALAQCVTLAGIVAAWALDDGPSAPTRQEAWLPARGKAAMRYYVPVHVQTGLEKKAS